MASKSRPTPLKDLQIAVHADDARRHLVLDPHSSFSPPAYPFGPQAALSSPLREDHSTWQVRVPASDGSPTCALPCCVAQLLDSLSSIPPLVQVEPSVVLSSSTPKNTINYRWNDPLASRDDDDLGPVSLHSLRPYRSFTPPISPPLLSSSGTDTEYSSKRSGMTFALVPAEVDGKHVFTHVVVSHQNDYKDNSSPPSIPPGEGLPEDMQDILRQLDDLASWVKAASSSRDCISNISASCLSDGLFPNKGKNRLLPTSPPSSECIACQGLVESSRGIMLGNPTDISRTDCQTKEYIYVPNCNTPEFLVGSSNSPVAYPVCGYSSHPSHCPPHSTSPTHDIPYHRRFFERRSAPCPQPASPLVSPPLGKTSFKTLFQRSRCNTTAVSRPSIPSGHVPVENALRQGKRMRFPWLRI